MVLLLDNLDSFTYNLAQALEELGAEVLVRRSDAGGLASLRSLKPSHLLVSPGPGRPQDAALALEAIAAFRGRVPVLGVCLGHQCLALLLGAVVERAARLMHGKTSPIRHSGQGLYAGLPEPFDATRYHSLAVRPGSLGPGCELTAWTDEGEVMGLRDKEGGAEGVQFHPESILTSHGKQLLSNFLARG